MEGLIKLKNIWQDWSRKKKKVVPTKQYLNNIKNEKGDVTPSIKKMIKGTNTFNLMELFQNRIKGKIFPN